MSVDNKHNHHYLPRFYLKYWANENNTVWVYTLQKSEGNRQSNPRLRHIECVCSEPCLYSIGKDLSIENWADTNVENYCAPVFKKIVRREQLNNDDIYYTKSFLALTMA